MNKSPTNTSNQSNTSELSDDELEKISGGMMGSTADVERLEAAAGAGREERDAPAPPRLRPPRELAPPPDLFEPVPHYILPPAPKVSPAAQEAVAQGRWKDVILEKSAPNTFALAHASEVPKPGKLSKLWSKMTGSVEAPRLTGAQLATLLRANRAVVDRDPSLREFGGFRDHPVTAELRRSALEVLTPIQKLRRAGHNAMDIGKGSSKILDEDYWPEATSATHSATDAKFLTPLWKGDSDWNTYFEIQIPGYVAWLSAHARESFPEFKKSFETLFRTHMGTDLDTWLQARHVNAGETVQYLKPSERRAYEIDFERGAGNAVLRRRDAPFDTATESTTFSGPGNAIFVLSPDGKLYAGSHTLGRFHHSSFLGAGAVQGAGELTTDASGHVTSITSKSGHYKPGDPQILSTLAFLESKGVDLSTVTFKDPFKEHGQVHEYNAKAYLDSRGSVAPTRVVAAT